VLLVIIACIGHSDWIGQQEHPASEVEVPPGDLAESKVGEDPDDAVETPE
jgi:hypothetical protein